MTVQDVRDRIAAIATADDEYTGRAHRLRDDLYADVLRAVANGHPDAAAMAAEALRAEQLNIKLWFA